jgi:formylglycine-generating enzyme required for sulfatase activity
VGNGYKSESAARWKFRPKVDYPELKDRLAALRKSWELPDVGSFSPLTDSIYKIADMNGAIMEWTQSLYAPYPYEAQDGRENLGGDEHRVIRGFFLPGNERFSVRSARRLGAPPDEKAPVLGFRIVIAPTTSK